MDKRQITVLLFDGLHLVDVAGPSEAMRHAGGYALRYASADGGPVRAQCGLQLMADQALAQVTGPSDLLVPGGDGIQGLLDETAVVDRVARWPDDHPGARIVSVCSGALLLAQAGLLRGRRATTHWCRAEQVSQAWPDTDWQMDAIHVEDGPIWTSAGVTSGIDLALALIRRDLGPDRALAVARQMLVAVQRGGGQAQYAALLTAQYAATDRLVPLIQAITDSPGRDWSLEQMADFAAMTPRTLSRQFQRDLRQPPARFVERVRTDWAGNALAGGARPQQVARAAGFGDLQRMDRAFQRQHGCSSRAWLARFSAPGPRPHDAATA